MTGKEFRRIRLSLMLTQQQLADILGYRQKVRISEYERTTNPIPVPEHVAALMRALESTGGRVGQGRLIREWNPRWGRQVA